MYCINQLLELYLQPDGLTDPKCKKASLKNKIPTIRVIPQGTVDNNLGPDRLAGPKALDPNYCTQPTL